MRGCARKYRLVSRLILVFTLPLFLFGGCKTTGSHSPGKVLRDIPRNERIALMVLNFKNTSAKASASEYQPWEFGIPSMIMTDLESIGLFNILSWEGMKDVLEQQAFQTYGLVDEEKAVEMGKIVAAKYTLSGSFMIMNGTLHMESKVFSVEEGTLVGAASVTGEVARFFELEKKLVIEMTSYMGAMLTPAEVAHLEATIETESVAASLDNYAGEVALLRAEEFKAKGNREGKEHLLREAKLRFEDALRHDPAYERAKNNLASLANALPMTL